MISVIGLDGDDTLWHNESIFSMTQDRFAALVAPYAPDTDLHDRLFSTEIANLAAFGYGIKGFTLSMIETAIEVSERRIPAEAIEQIIEAGKSMLDHPVELLDGVTEAVEALARTHRLVLVTKGDLFDQESKLARSGLAELFWRVEVVSAKDEGTYQRILRRHEIAPEGFLMAGNSVRSDVVPVAAIGGWAVHIPYRITWAHEVVDDHCPGERCFELDSIAELPDLVTRIDADNVSQSG